MEKIRTHALKTSCHACTAFFASYCISSHQSSIISLRYTDVSYKSVINVTQHMDAEIIQKLDTFFSAYPVRSYQKGECIISAAKQPAGIFYVEEGIVRHYYLSEEGQEVTLNLFKPHSFLPMSWAIAEIPNHHWYEAMTNVRTRCASKKAVLHFIKQEPDILYDLLRRIYIGIEGLWEHVESLAAGNARVKLASTLVILSKRFGETSSEGITVTLPTHENDLAALAGITRETASRELQKLKKQRIATLHKGTITIHNLHALEQILLS